MRRRDFLFFTAPTLLAMTLLLLVPLAVTIGLSVSDFEFGRPLHFVGAANFVAALTDPRFWRSVVWTTVFTLVTTVLKLLVGYGLALLLIKVVRGRSFFLGLLLVPMVVPPVVGALVFSWMFKSDLGLYDYLLSLVGLHVDWFTNPGAARTLLVIHDVWHQSIFAGLILLAGLAGMPHEPLEAAAVDGASWWQRQRHVVIPSLGGLITFISIMSVMDGFRVFDAFSVITKGGPAGATESIMLFNYDVAMRQGHLGFGTAVSVMAIVGIVVLLVPLLRRTLREIREA